MLPFYFRGGILAVSGRDDFHIDRAVNGKNQAENYARDFDNGKLAFPLFNRVKHRAAGVRERVGDQRHIEGEHNRLNGAQHHGTRQNESREGDRKKEFADYQSDPRGCFKISFFQGRLQGGEDNLRHNDFKRPE